MEKITSNDRKGRQNTKVGGTDLWPDSTEVVWQIGHRFLVYNWLFQNSFKLSPFHCSSLNKIILPFMWFYVGTVEYTHDVYVAKEKNSFLVLPNHALRRKVCMKHWIKNVKESFKVKEVPMNSTMNNPYSSPSILLSFYRQLHKTANKSPHTNHNNVIMVNSVSYHVFPGDRWQYDILLYWIV